MRYTRLTRGIVAATGIAGSLLGCLCIAIQLAFVLAVMGGIAYFIVFACTHWLKW